MDRPPTRRPSPALIGVGVLVVALGLGVPRLLSEPTAAPAAASPAGPGLTASLARMACGVTVAGGLCVAVTRLIRRPDAVGPGGMAVVESVAVDARCTLSLVQTGDRRLLVGIDRSGVKAVVELTGPPPVAGPTVIGPVRIGGERGA